MIMETLEERISPERTYSDCEMLGDPQRPPLAEGENGDSQISQISETFSNSTVVPDATDSALETTTATETLSKKPAKRRKTEKNASFSLIDFNSSSIFSSISSPSNSVTVTPARQKPTTSGTLPTSGKDKDRSLIYVNYLNAFANSLNSHSSQKRFISKATNDDSSSPPTAPSTLSSTLDFEIGGTKLGQTTFYFADLDRNRCSHFESFCPFSKRENYQFCEKHLLDDKGLPFVPCAFQRLESNPCPYPARMPPGAGGKNRPQRSKEALCTLHMEKCMQEVKQHMNCSANGVFSTMDGLEKYNKNEEKGLPPTKTNDFFDDLAEPQTRDYLETYLRATAKETYATNSSSENSFVEEENCFLFRGNFFETEEEIDSGEEEPLKYSNKFSVEELTRILRGKIAKQKELLAAEMRLQEYKLKDARAKYLTEVFEERSFLPSVHTQAKLDAESCTAYRNIRTMLRIDKKRPKFSFLHSRKPSTLLRHNGRLPESVFRCLHTDTGQNGKTLKCRQYSLPFSRHCLSHILEDQYQYLYKRCAQATPTQCNNPIIKNLGGKFCFLHTELNIERIGPNLSHNDSHAHASSSSEVEAEPTTTVVAVSTKMNPINVKQKKSIRENLRFFPTFLPSHVETSRVVRTESNSTDVQMTEAPPVVQIKQEVINIDD